MHPPHGLGCVSYFSVVVRKYHEQKQLRGEKGLLWLLDPEASSLMKGKAWQQEEEAS